MTAPAPKLIQVATLAELGSCPSCLTTNWQPCEINAEGAIRVAGIDGFCVNCTFCQLQRAKDSWAEKALQLEAQLKQQEAATTATELEWEGVAVEMVELLESDGRITRSLTHKVYWALLFRLYGEYQAHLASFSSEGLNA